MLNEGDIKAAVINRLFKNEALNDAVLINEMVVDNWSRRADLVVANGKLSAYEIKSDLDSLRRLEGQLETYLNLFDKVTVVCTPRFLHEVINLADKRVEIWSIEETSSGVVVKVVRRGTSVAVKNKKILSGFLLKGELIELLSSQGIFASADMARCDLEQSVEIISIKTVRAFVLSALKSRYRDTFNMFCQKRYNITRPEDLLSLRKPPRGGDLNSAPCEVKRAVDPSVIFPIDLNALEKKYGPLPINMPQFIIKRA